MKNDLKSQIDKFLFPKSVAILGASRSPAKFGNLFLRSFKFNRFPGKIFPINPKADEILEIKTYKNILDIEDPIDLAIITTHPDQNINLVKDCINKGIEAIIIFSAGYAEIGDSGKEREKELLEIIKGKARVLGPNCIGVHSAPGKVSAFPAMSFDLNADVTILSQSGYLTSLLSRAFTARGIPITFGVSLGNSIDLNICDFLEYFRDDEYTKYICMYLEGVSQGKRFRNLCKDLYHKKQLIIWKPGSSKAGRKAISTHTASITGKNEIWDGIFRQYKIFRVNSAEEIINQVIALKYSETLKGPKVGIVGSQGGLTVTTAENCELFGIQLAELTEKTKNELKKIIPEFGTSVNNPVDISIAAAMNPKLYEESGKIIIKDPNVDILLLNGTWMMDRQFVKYLMKIRKINDKPFFIIEPSVPEKLKPYEKLYRNNIGVAFTSYSLLKFLKRAIDYRTQNREEKS
ncbi:MAG: CoA-binding protein [Candidatus Helarchaeota archaeon]